MNQFQLHLLFDSSSQYFITNASSNGVAIDLVLRRILPNMHEGVAESAASSLWLCSLNYLVVKAFLLGQKADKFASNLQRAEAAEREGDSS
jgi:hypothetical protein